MTRVENRSTAGIDLSGHQNKIWVASGATRSEGIASAARAGWQLDGRKPRGLAPGKAVARFVARSALGGPQDSMTDGSRNSMKSRSYVSARCFVETVETFVEAHYILL